MYTQTDVTQAKQSIRKDIIVAIPLIAATVALYVYGIQAGIRWVVFVAGALFFIVCCFLWSMYFWPHIRYYRFLHDINTGLSREMHGKLERIGEENELQDGVWVRSVYVFLEEEQDERILYINIDKMGELPAVGMPLNVRCYGRHIRAVEK